LALPKEDIEEGLDYTEENFVFEDERTELSQVHQRFLDPWLSSS
jgi:hypothetical protein